MSEEQSNPVKEQTSSTEKKPKKKTTKPSTTATAKKDDKPKKKPGISKKAVELIKKAKEEQEKLEKEKEEQLRKIQEEEERLEKQRQEEEAIKQEKRRIKKEKEKEKKKLKEQQAQQEKMEMIRKQLLSQQGITVGPKENNEKPKKVVYEKKKKSKKPTDQLEEPPSEPIEKEKIEPKEEKEPKKEEVADDWDEIAEDWENIDLNSDSKAKTETAQKNKEPINENHKNNEDNHTSNQKKGNKKKGKGKNNNQVEDENEDGKENLRSPICCILGHVDTGKTKLLDKIRRSNVQEGEAGGITQQIGATFFPMSAIEEQTSKLSKASKLEWKVPGLLIIDTPGHESFTNLRSRGSGLCDIAILVVDIMHGLEPQTIESINLLKMRKTPFVVALNKIDRIYGWKPRPNSAFQNTLKAQDKFVQQEFEDRVQETITLFAEQALNAVLYYKNKDFRKYVSLVPTSAITGEGIPDLLGLLIQLTQNMMSDKLLYLTNLQCTVLEVKVVEGLGTTIDVILVNGVLNEGDTIVVCGLNGPIVTTIRALLTPHPLKEIRVKGQYIHHKQVKAALGVKICAHDLEKAVAGSSLLVAGPDDNIEDLKKEVMLDLESMLQKKSNSDYGVYVQASTLGSLEALLKFLTDSKIPFSAVNIGPVNKKDVMKASVMLEHAKEYAVILAFDVKVTKDAQNLADELGVKIFTADIIYHLFDQFTDYIEKIRQQRKEESSAEAVFPCRLKIIPEFIFNKRNPIILGVEVLEGVLKIGTPICVPSKEFIELGRIASLEVNHKPVQEARKGTSVAIKIEAPETETQKAFGRNFDEKDELVSKITKKSIELIKEYKAELIKEDVQLLAKLKVLFGIK